MQSLFTTTLMVRDEEVTYQVYQETSTGRYNFQPKAPEVGLYSSPSFWMYKKQQDWVFLGIANSIVEIQAKKKLTTFLELQTVSPSTNTAASVLTYGASLLTRLPNKKTL